MPGRVDEVDLLLVPLGVGEAGRQRVLAGDFFFVEVGDGRAFVDLAEAVDHAGVDEDGGGELRLAGTAVTDERDVSDAGGVVDLHRRSPPRNRRIDRSQSPAHHIGEPVAAAARIGGDPAGYSYRSASIGSRREALNGGVHAEEDADRGREAEADRERPPRQRDGEARHEVDGPADAAAERDAEQAAEPRSGTRPPSGTGRGSPTRRAPSALRTPISRVRSVTEIDMIAITPMPPTISAIDEITTSAKNVPWLIWSHSLRNASCVTDVEVVRLVEPQAVADAHHALDVGDRVGLADAFARHQRDLNRQERRAACRCATGFSPKMR